MCKPRHFNGLLIHPSCTSVTSPKPVPPKGKVLALYTQFCPSSSFRSFRQYYQQICHSSPLWGPQNGNFLPLMLRF